MCLRQGIHTSSLLAIDMWFGKGGWMVTSRKVLPARPGPDGARGHLSNCRSGVRPSEKIQKCLHIRKEQAGCSMGRTHNVGIQILNLCLGNKDLEKEIGS